MSTYKITIERIEPPIDDQKYGRDTTIYTQTVAREYEESFVKSIVEAVNVRELERLN